MLLPAIDADAPLDEGHLCRASAVGQRGAIGGCGVPQCIRGAIERDVLPGISVAGRPIVRGKPIVQGGVGRSVGEVAWLFDGDTAARGEYKSEYSETGA